MRGQLFTVAQLNYINGVVYFVAQREITNLTTLSEHSPETTKSGKAMHPKVRVRTMVKFANGLGLVKWDAPENVQITELGKQYYQARTSDKWSLSNDQQKLLREHIISNPSRSPVTHAIYSLYELVEEGYQGQRLMRLYAVAIEKQKAWKSQVTCEGFTEFGLHYLVELGLIDREKCLRLMNHLGDPEQDATKINSFLCVESPKTEIKVAKKTTQKAINNKDNEQVFCDQLMKKWGGCSVTDLSTPDLLKVYRIKPCDACTYDERFDLDNGLLLNPAIGHLFEIGWVSFSDTGSIQVSFLLSMKEAEQFGVTSSMALRKISEKTRVYLRYHRKHIFKQNASFTPVVEPPPAELSEEERVVWNLLSQTPIHVDEICAQCSLGTACINGVLLKLEFKKLAHRCGPNQYIRT